MKRSFEKELLDLGPPHYTDKEYEACLDQLGRVGTFLGAQEATFKAFHPFKPQTILDVGCGGGYFAFELAKKFPQAKVVGVDISANAITHAQKRLEKQSFVLKNISFKEGSFLKEPFDVVTATLVCHHLNDEEMVEFIKTAYQTAKKGVIINDLHRHPLAYMAFGLIAYPLFQNRLIFHDGLLSIKRSFKKEELFQYLKAAGIPLERCSIKWHFPFRWVISIDKRCSS